MQAPLSQASSNVRPDRPHRVRARPLGVGRVVRATKLCFPPRMAPLRALACVGVLARPPCQAGSLHACPCGGVPEPVRDVDRRQSAADAASHGRHLSHGGQLRDVHQLGWLLVARGAEPARAESASEVRGAEYKCWKLRGANVGCSLGVHTMETKTTKHKNKAYPYSCSLRHMCTEILRRMCDDEAMDDVLYSLF